MAKSRFNFTCTSSRSRIDSAANSSPMWYLAIASLEWVCAISAAATAVANRLCSSLIFRDCPTTPSDSARTAISSNVFSISPILRLACLLAITIGGSVSHAANYVPNSSFEVGAGRGWIANGGPSDANAGNLSAMASRIVTTNAAHGGKCFRFWSQLMTRPMWLQAGSKTTTWSGRDPGGGVVVFYELMAYNRMILGLSPPSVPSNLVAVTTGWTRFTNTVTVQSNGFYWLKWYHAQPWGVDIDAIQVEDGSTATAYAPKTTIELGIDTIDPDNTLLSGDTKAFRLVLWNDGGAASVTPVWNEFGLWNSNFSTGTFTTNLPASTNSVFTIPTTRMGWRRVVGYLTGVNDSMEEITMSVLPYAADTAQNTNGLLGSHPGWGKYAVTSQRRAGFAFGRDLSQAECARWSNVQPNATTTNWPDTCMASISTNGQVGLFSLTFGALDGDWNTWATNANGTPNINAYSNFCYGMVSRYRDAPYNAKYWEIGNEPQNNMAEIHPNDFNEGATNYAVLLTAAARAVKLADPDAYVLGMAGLADGDYAWQIYTNLTQEAKDDLNAVSGHLYPNDNGSDPNLTENDNTRFASVWKWAKYFGTNKPIWNTESGTFGISWGTKGQNAIWPAFFNPLGAGSEVARNERMLRQLPSTDRITQVAFRSLGWGFRNFTWYDGRYANDSHFITTQPALWDFGGQLRPQATATLMVNYFGGVGLGRVTNVNAATIEAYYFTNTLGSTIVAWTYDRTSKTMTLSNAAVALYDVMGNQLQTNSAAALVNRTARWFVTGALTAAQLKATFENATVAAATDTLPPNVSIDISPIGSLSSGSDLLAKWTAIEETSLPYTTEATATNITYRYRTSASGTWTDYSQSNHVWLSLGPGIYRLGVQAKDAQSNESQEVTGPQFTVAGSPTTIASGNIHFSGTASLPVTQ